MKHLRTIKKASQETGASISFFKQLIREGKLNRYKINTATYISLTEFEALATATSENANIAKANYVNKSGKVPQSSYFNLHKEVSGLSGT